MEVTIELRRLRAFGCHGVLPEEQARAQPFEVDLALTADVEGTGTDDLADTVDYGILVDAVATCVAGESHQLLERLAERIASIALEDERVATVTVTVKKLEPPVAAEIGHVAVRITRRRVGDAP